MMQWIRTLVCRLQVLWLVWRLKRLLFAMERNPTAAASKVLRATMILSQMIDQLQEEP